MASFTNYKIDFTPTYTNHYWRVELVAWLIKKGDPGLKGEIDEIVAANSDLVRAEFSLALTCPQVVEIRRGRSIAKTWARLEDIFEYYGPVGEAPLFRQVAHQYLDGRPEMKDKMLGFLDEIEETEGPLTVLRNLITNPTLFQLRKKLTGTLDPLGLLGGVQQLCGCNPYVPKEEIPESQKSLTECLYCKYDTAAAKASEGGNQSDGDKSTTKDRKTVVKPRRVYYAVETPEDDKRKPYLKIELVSIFKLTASEHHIIFKRDEATIVSNTGDVKLRATRAGARFFKMELDGVKTQPPDYADFVTWHRRLGHVDFRDLHYGYRQFAYRGLKILKSSKSEPPTCQICQAIKLPGLPLRPVQKVETQVLDLIHADFCGPIPGQTKDSVIFIITFTDDASGWMSMYFIRHCTQVLKFFKEFVNQAEGQCQRKIRCLQSNDGLGHDFNDYLKIKGIERLNIPSDTQHIRGLLETTKCLLMQSGLDDSFYCEALNTACFIRNRSSFIRLDGLTPYQKWYGRPPSLRHMHEFGAKVTCKIRRDDKGKGEAKKGQFLGFAKKHRAYRVWVPEYQQIILSDEVDFDEYINSNTEINPRVERPRTNIRGTDERPGTSKDADGAKTTGKQTRPVIPRRKIRTRFSRYDSRPPDYSVSIATPKTIDDYMRQKIYNCYDSNDEDVDSDMEADNIIYEEDESDAAEKGNESNEGAAKGTETVKPDPDSATKQPTPAEPAVEGPGPGAIPKRGQGAPGVEGTRTPSIATTPTRPRDKQTD